MAGPTTVAKAKQVTAASTSATTSTQQLQTEAALQSVEVRRESTSTRGVAVTVNSTTVQKRKREGSDQQGAAGVTGEAGRRGGNKRVATNGGAVVPASSAVSAKGTDATESSATPLVSAPEDSATVDDNDDEETEVMDQPSTGAVDFGSLPQGQNGGSGAQPANGTDQSDATSTAVAALAGIFPTMTVPQPTDISFANSSGTDNDRNLDPSFNEGTSLQAGANADSDGSPQGGAGRQSSGGESGGARKPIVGSEEWHRVRRDNHKEGKFSTTPIPTARDTARDAKTQRRRDEPPLQPEQPEHLST